MSESGSSSLGADSELDDPGRDPKGLDPPRNLFGGGPDQDSGQGKPQDSPGVEGQGLMPESPTEDDERA
ncbi:hypothetical protein FHU33_1337 [Blastococcus colisei]|uniref:Uncharacterized protein n=1 Tax=Blastococcus colisei TaxID=1564162 RepID=A0A543PCX8_9ACTN|nr:hypothetical protein [Blastococcus colisei]TQN41948.1 hypothetical protein FHU33_1337 [Blastococcus colisei]